MQSTDSYRKVAEIRVNKLAINLVAVPITVVLCAASIWLALALPHAKQNLPSASLWLLLFLFILVVVHEVLHAFAIVCWGKLSWRAMKFGVMWKALMPYCHCTILINLKVCRVQVLFPLYVTGLLTFLFLLAFPSLESGLACGVALSVCVGDVWLFIRLRKFPDAFFYKDDPKEIGGWILEATTPEHVS